MLRNFIMTFGAAVLLAGCAPSMGVYLNNTVPPSVETQKKFQGGTTNMTFSAHGTQVEFLSKDGRTALWYPGNNVVLHGRWRLAGGGQANGSQDAICFQYGANTYNPLTFRSGGGWDCEGLARYQGRVVDHVAGDPFGLDKREAVPFILPGERTTFAQLRKRRF